MCMKKLLPMTGRQLLDDLDEDLATIDDSMFTDEELKEMETRYGVLALPEALDPRNKDRKAD